MLKSEFEKIPNGTIFKIPGVRKVFVKAQVYFEEQYLALPYDGRRNILLIKDIPEDIKIEKGDPNLLYVPERDEKNYLEMCEKNNKKLDEIDRIQREKGKLLYRFIQLPYADGYAVYQIVYISGQQVRVHHVTGIGSDYSIPELVDGGFFPKESAILNIERRDRISSYKNPTIKNISDTTNGEEPAYARMTIYVQDPNGNLITDQTALDLIEQTIRFDGSYTGNYANAGKATGLVEGRIPGYSLADISKYPMVNPKWSKDTVRSTANKWVFNYNGDNNGILKSGEESTLFTTVAIPTDWNQTQLKSIGSGVAGTYKLHIVTEAIQASGFATQADAYNALDKEIAAGTLQHIDRN